MKFFAAQGLVGDISDVWQNVNGMPDAIKTASTGDDGKQYFIPFTNYPWAIYYRPSVFQAKGYQVPKTLDELVTLSTQMQKDGLTPLAFADKDGWPAMGTFDQLNLRINGYDFHVSLMAGKEAWDSDKVKKVFDTWNRLLPFHQPDSLGAPGRRPRSRCSRRSPGCTCWACSSASSSPRAPTRTTWTSSRSLKWTRRSARPRSRLPSTVS